MNNKDTNTSTATPKIAIQSLRERATLTQMHEQTAPVPHRQIESTDRQSRAHGRRSHAHIVLIVIQCARVYVDIARRARTASPINAPKHQCNKFYATYSNQYNFNI